jgi:hypothetical protein
MFTDYLANLSKISYLKRSFETSSMKKSCFEYCTTDCMNDVHFCIFQIIHSFHFCRAGIQHIHNQQDEQQTTTMYEASILNFVAGRGI